MNRTYDVVVVVAGILGASTAYHLKRNGVVRVALLGRRGTLAPLLLVVGA